MIGFRPIVSICGIIKLCTQQTLYDLMNQHSFARMPQVQQQMHTHTANGCAHDKHTFQTNDSAAEKTDTVSSTRTAFRKLPTLIKELPDKITPTELRRRRRPLVPSQIFGSCLGRPRPLRDVPPRSAAAGHMAPPSQQDLRSKTSRHLRKQGPRVQIKVKDELVLAMQHCSHTTGAGC